MAKIIAPPVINDLTELLDVVLHPNKYIEYLKQLQDMYNAIMESLDIVQTKEDADKYLSLARQRLDEASAKLKKASADSDAEYAKLKVSIEELFHQAQQQEALLVTKYRDEELRARHMEARHRDLEATGRLQAERQQELEGRAIVLASQKAQLDEQVTKFQSMKAYLAAQGV